MDAGVMTERLTSPDLAWQGIEAQCKALDDSGLWISTISLVPSPSSSAPSPSPASSRDAVHYKAQVHPTKGSTGAASKLTVVIGSEEDRAAPRGPSRRLGEAGAGEAGVGKQWRPGGSPLGGGSSLPEASPGSKGPSIQERRCKRLQKQLTLEMVPSRGRAEAALAPPGVHGALTPASAAGTTRERCPVPLSPGIAASLAHTGVLQPHFLHTPAGSRVTPRVRGPQGFGLPPLSPRGMALPSGPYVPQQQQQGTKIAEPLKMASPSLRSSQHSHHHPPGAGCSSIAALWQQQQQQQQGQQQQVESSVLGAMQRSLTLEGLRIASPSPLQPLAQLHSRHNPGSPLGMDAGAWAVFQRSQTLEGNCRVVRTAGYDMLIVGHNAMEENGVPAAPPPQDLSPSRRPWSLRHASTSLTSSPTYAGGHARQLSAILGDSLSRMNQSSPQAWGLRRSLMEGQRMGGVEHASPLWTAAAPPPTLASEASAGPPPKSQLSPSAQGEKAGARPWRRRSVSVGEGQGKFLRSTTLPVKPSDGGLLGRGEVSSTSLCGPPGRCVEGSDKTCPQPAPGAPASAQRAGPRPWRRRSASVGEGFGSLTRSTTLPMKLVAEASEGKAPEAETGFSGEVQGREQSFDRLHDLEPRKDLPLPNLASSENPSQGNRGSCFPEGKCGRSKSRGSKDWDSAVVPAHSTASLRMPRVPQPVSEVNSALPSSSPQLDASKELDRPFTLHHRRLSERAVKAPADGSFAEEGHPDKSKGDGPVAGERGIRPWKAKQKKNSYSSRNTVGKFPEGQDVPDGRKGGSVKDKAHIQFPWNLGGHKRRASCSDRRLQCSALPASFWIACSAPLLELDMDLFSPSDDEGVPSWLDEARFPPKI